MSLADKIACLCSRLNKDLEQKEFFFSINGLVRDESGCIQEVSIYNDLYVIVVGFSILLPKNSTLEDRVEEVILICEKHGITRDMFELLPKAYPDGKIYILRLWLKRDLLDQVLLNLPDSPTY